jgi:hypothetical protein
MSLGRRPVGERRRGVQISARDVALLRWIGEQYSVRADLLAVLMARHSDDPSAQARGALAPRVVNRRIQAWRQAGLVRTRTFLMATPATVWLTADGLAVAGLPWRPYEPTLRPSPTATPSASSAPRRRRCSG